MKKVGKQIQVKRWWGLGLIAVLFSAATLFAQRADKKEEYRAKMKTYFEENILPVMKTQREKLDGYLTLQELEQVEELRATLHKMHEEGKAMRKAFREGRQEGERPTFEEIEERRSAHQARQKAHRQVMTAAWAIVDNHESEMNVLFDEVADERKQWFEDLNAMREEMKSKRGEGEEGNHFRPRKGRKGKGHRGGMHHGQGKMGARGPFGMLEGPGFLLWDPAEPFQFAPERPEGGQGRSMGFPNPVDDSFNINYEVSTAGDVIITIHSRGGDLVKTIDVGSKAKGTYTSNIDVSDLSEGLYLYKVSTPDGTETKRFLKE